MAAREITIAAKAAARVTASFPPVDPSLDTRSLGREFADLVAEAEPRIAEETTFTTDRPARAEVVGRSEWAVTNVDSLTTLLEPVFAKLERRLWLRPGTDVARLAYGPLMGAQLGAVLGFLSQRVLGQYDLLAGHEDKVWFVGPNILMVEKRFKFEPRDFRLWITLHELTHRAQFEGVPWLRGHFRSLVDSLFDSMDVEPRKLIVRVGDALKGARDVPLGLRLMGEEQHQMFRDIQAFMSVIEGHGNFVMDRVGEGLIPTQPRMRSVLRANKPSGSLLSKILWKLLGLDLKLAQYEQGQRFFDALYQSGGTAAVASCFESPHSLPTLDEVRNPELWLSRNRS